MAPERDRRSFHSSSGKVDKSGAGCLSENDVLDLVSGEMDDNARAAAREHLASCPACRKLVSEAVRAIGDASTRASPSDPSAPSISTQHLPGIGDVVADKYRLERVVGHGGMGVVFEATHLVLEHPVAVKFLWSPTELNEAAKQRFLREARTAVTIQSDYVTRVMDVALTKDGLPFVVMELLAGNDLGVELEQRGTIPWKEVVDWMLQVLDAVGAAHEMGIVHRDLKPANLFLSQGPYGKPRVKVLDFGLSKLFAANHPITITTTATMLGSPAYMAPEQMEDSSKVDVRADVWSLGVTMYELMTGHLPHQGSTVASLYRSIRESAVPSVCKHIPNVPESVDDVVRLCMMPERGERFSSASVMRDALLEALQEGASVAPVPKKARTRSRATLGVAFLVAFAAMFALAAIGFRLVGKPDDGGTVGLTDHAVLGSSAADPTDTEKWNEAGLEEDASVIVVVPSESVPESVQGSKPSTRDPSPQPSPPTPAPSPKTVSEENAWADRQLDEAQKLRDVEQKVRLLTEVEQSGADEERRSRARSLLAAITRTPAAKTVKQPPSKEPVTTATTETPPPPSTSTGVLPPRY